MKKVALFALILVALSSIVFAENSEPQRPVDTYELEDLSKTPVQAVWLKTGDFVFFNLLGKRHAVRMDLVYNNNAKIVLYPDIDTSPQGAYSPIARDRYIKVDLNKDEATDMIIRLDSMQGSDDGDEGLFVFESLVSDNAAPGAQGMATVPEPEKKSNSPIYFGFAVAMGALLGLLVIFGLKRKNSH